ncbi:hypothetical protein NONI108955_01005 [Nocardia ninae]|uniref:Pyridoxamine 5'-phosphate oxidase putative domain-containing protein n=1 Tax=Nocardia ninae NBRC 108245 TaxID=1210091 RepID=A0A511MEA5_9NOCA|nr:hypothetical protein [Nocardia ninae]GEM38156.1 hypothetical protein NN4_26750 [Nocardia ninae NBRC 108245]
MTDTLVDLTVDSRQVARPDVRPQRWSGGRSDNAKVWRDAKTVLVTRVTGPRQLMTVPRLVIPIGETQLAFRVSSQSEEAEQLARDGRVLVQPGDRRGTPALGSHQRQGQAQLVTAGTLLPYVESEIAAKYKWRIPVARFAHRLGHGDTPYADVVVLVTVAEPSPIPILPR